MSTGICHLCTKPGQCCTYVELPVKDARYEGAYPEIHITVERPLTLDEINWVNLHPGIATNGVTATIITSPSVMGNTVHIESRCKALVPETGLCGLYGNGERPEMCSRWPDAPESQAPEGCAYLTPEHRALIQENSNGRNSDRHAGGVPYPGAVEL